MKLLKSLLVFSFFLPSPAFAESTQAARTMQTKNFEENCAQVTKAAMNTLQDFNFQIKEADNKAGFIHARTGEKKNALMGTTKSVDTSITFDDSEKNNCLVRANFFQVNKKSSIGLLAVGALITTTALGVNTYGGLAQSGYEKGTLIVDSKVYENFFTSMNKQLFISNELKK